MSDDTAAPGGHLAQATYTKNNISNPIPVQTTASPPELPRPAHSETPPAVAPSSGHQGLSPGAVAGVSVGLALGILILAVLICVGYRSRRRRRHSRPDGETSLGEPPGEGPKAAEKSLLVHAARTPHFGPCSKLTRPNWTVDRNAAHFGQSATLKPPPAPPRPKRLPASSLVGREVFSPSGGGSLRSPRRPCGITSAGSVQLAQPPRVHRPPTPYYSNFKTYKPAHGTDPFTLSKLEGCDWGMHHAY